MGHYDEEFVPERYRRKRKKKNTFLSGLIGAIIGGFIVLIFGSFFLNNDQAKDGNLGINQPQGTKITRQVSYEVDTTITKAVEKVADSVVGITNIQGASFWTQAQEAGTGSGVVYKVSGDSAYIVTNYHVIEGANSLEVTLADGTKLPAELVGSDIWTDLAVIKVDSGPIKTVAEFGNSDTLKLGETVIAIGNPLGLEFAGSITMGIISGLERTVPMDFDGNGIVDWNAEVLQTDAAINPGNSGGALVNIAGQVIGINSMKIAQQEVEGIGFSIPANSAIPVIEDIEQYGKVRRPYMGVGLQSLSDLPYYHQQETLHLPGNVKGGVVVTEVARDTPASQAGLKRLDVIIKLDNKEVETLIDLRKYLYTNKQAGATITVGFYRNGEYLETKLILAESE